jgi:hypothetical protein
MLQAAVLIGSGANGRSEDSRRPWRIGESLLAACVSQLQRCRVPV